MVLLESMLITLIIKESMLITLIIKESMLITLIIKESYKNRIVEYYKNFNISISNSL
jgi:hypothetical protein